VDETTALKHHFDLIGPSGRAISALDASDSELMKDVSDAQLADFIEFDVLEQLQGHAEKLAQVIDDTLPTLKKINAKRVKKETSTRHSEQTTKHFQHDSLHFNFDYHQNFHNMLKQHKPGGGFSIFSSIQKSPHLSKHRDIIMAKHQLRQEALGENMCLTKCDPGDWECNCKNLFPCVKNLTEYDVAVLIAGG
jgi:hypothetical protein